MNFADKFFLPRIKQDISAMQVLAARYHYEEPVPVVKAFYVIDRFPTQKPFQLRCHFRVDIFRANLQYLLVGVPRSRRAGLFQIGPKDKARLAPIDPAQYEPYGSPGPSL